MLDSIRGWCTTHKDSFLKPAGVFICICLAVAIMLTGANFATEGILDAKEKQSRSDTMRRLMPAGTYKESTLKTQDGEKVTYHVAKDGGRVVGYIFIVDEKGFGGMVTVMTAVYYDGTISAVVILDASGETPGLGDKIKEAEFCDQFKGKTTGISLLKGGADEARNEVDAVTRATVSSRAVTRAVNKSLTYFEYAAPMEAPGPEGEAGGSASEASGGESLPEEGSSEAVGESSEAEVPAE